MFLNRLLVLLGVCFLTVSAAWADDVGYVDCSSHSEGAQVFAKPRKTPDVLASLPCGERFTVLVYGFVFSQIQTRDGRAGFIYSNLIAIDHNATSVQQTGSLQVASARTKIPSASAPAADATPSVPAQPQPAAAPRVPAKAADPTPNAPQPIVAVAQTAPSAPVESQPEAPPVTRAPAAVPELPLPGSAPPVAQPNPPASTQPQPAAAPPTSAQPVPSQPAQAPAPTVTGPAAPVTQPDPPAPAQPQPAAAPPTPAQSALAQSPQAPAAAPESASTVAEPAAPAAQPEPAAVAQPQPASAQPTPAQPAAVPAAAPARAPIRRADRASWEKPNQAARKPARFEFYGGYAFARMGASGGGTFANLNGAMGSVALNIRPWLQITADSTYSYVTVSGTKNTLYGNHFGPRYFYRHRNRWGATPFVEALVGGSRSDTTVSGTGGYQASANCLSYKAGGGLDIHPTHHWEIRVLDVDYYRTAFGTGLHQNNYWVSTGVVFYLFGGGVQ